MLYALPQLAPHVAAWAKRASAQGGVSADERARRVVRKSVALARRDGAVAGSSFYVGMPAALAAIYWHQLLMVLRIAALYGHDPADPRRAAEVLVIQGRHPDLDSAAAALRAAIAAERGQPRPGAWTAARGALRQLPGMIGMRLRERRSARPLDRVISTLQLASYLIPVVGIPSGAAASARASKKLGQAAIGYYDHRLPPPGELGFALPALPSRRQRSRLTAAAELICAVPALLVLVFDGGIHGLKQQWLLTTVAELFLIATFGRLLWITRPPRPRQGE